MEEQEEKTFTQDDIDRIVTERLSREREKYSDYDVLKEKAAKFDAAEEASKTELQKAQEDVSRYKAESERLQAEMRMRDARAKVAAEKGIPAELLHGTTEEELSADADKLLKWHGENPTQKYPSVHDGGSPSGAPSGKTRDQFASWFSSVVK